MRDYYRHIYKNNSTALFRSIPGRSLAKIDVCVSRIESWLKIVKSEPVLIVDDLLRDPLERKCYWLRFATCKHSAHRRARIQQQLFVGLRQSATLDGIVDCATFFNHLRVDNAFHVWNIPSSGVQPLKLDGHIHTLSWRGPHSNASIRWIKSFFLNRKRNLWNESNRQWVSRILATLYV